jgi:hypothetical protein
MPRASEVHTRITSVRHAFHSLITFATLHCHDPCHAVRWCVFCLAVHRRFLFAAFLDGLTARHSGQWQPQLAVTVHAFPR